MPGATFEARWASTASPIEDVIANRSPKVATAHSMITSAGASSSSAPTWETSSRSSSGVRPSVWVPLKSRAACVDALMRGPLGVVRGSEAEEKNVVGCSCGTSTGPDHPGHLDGEAAQARAALPGTCTLLGEQVLVPAVGAVEGLRALAHQDATGSPRSRTSS